MSIVIQKYGGTSVGSIERMRHVADLIVAERKAGHKVGVIASAMAGATNQLVSLANNFVNTVGTAAYDFVISTGENVSCGMLALALAEKGVKAFPLAGWQVPIRTNGLYSRARVTHINTENLNRLLDSGVVPIITGFQGVEEGGTITTLGRGGSDTSAVAIAVALGAKRCDIYTDIDGIYTADPRVVAEASFISHVPYSIAFQMAALGTKVIHPRAVECSMESNMPLRILSSFGSDRFTLLSKDDSQSSLVGISHLTGCVMLSVLEVSDFQFRELLQLLKDKDIPVDMVSRDHSRSALQLCVEHTDEGTMQEILQPYAKVIASPRYGKVSLVGRQAKEKVNEIVRILQKGNINIGQYYVDNLRVSILVPPDQMEQAINLLHYTFFSNSTKKD